MDVYSNPSAPPRLTLAERYEQLLAVAARSHLRASLLLIGVCLILFLPGFFTLPAVDRDEARFAQATRQMIETGDYIDIRFQEEARHKKPVGIYWLQAGVVKTAQAVIGQPALEMIWLYRLPSLLGAIGGVLLVYWTALSFVERRGAFLAALMLASSILLGVEARLAKTDAMLFASITAMMGAMARAYFAERLGDRAVSVSVFLIFWGGLTAAILLKGPVVLMIVGLTALALSVAAGSWRWLLLLRPLYGVLLTAVLASPWFIAIAVQSSGEFFSDSLRDDLMNKVVSGQETHGAPPGMYLLTVWGTFWPTAPLLALAFPYIWKIRRQPDIMFLLCWLVPSWLIFEAVPTKLPHYILPLLPAAAILTVKAMEDHRMATPVLWYRNFALLWPVIGCLLPAVALATLFYFEKSPAVLSWPLIGLAMIFSFLAWWYIREEGEETSFLRAVTAASVIYIVVFAIVLPSLRTVWLSPRVAKIAELITCPSPELATAGYREPSLVFYLGTDLVMTTGAGAADFLGQGGCRAAVIEKRLEKIFVERAEQVGLRYALIGRVEGYTYNGGRPVSLAVYQATGQ